MQLGDEIARGALPAGVSPGFTHALIAATPAWRPGGIGKHKDGECVPGSALLALELEGSKVAHFDVPGHGVVKVTGDYLATKGFHVDVEHWVETEGYSLSITFRV